VRPAVCTDTQKGRRRSTRWRTGRNWEHEQRSTGTMSQENRHRPTLHEHTARPTRVHGENDVDSWADWIQPEVPGRPIVQVHPESTFCGHLLEIPIDCCHHPNINASGVRASESFELLLLNRAQSVGCSSIGMSSERHCVDILPIRNTRFPNPPSVMNALPGVRHAVLRPRWT
jgi:hypothetical protein